MFSFVVVLSNVTEPPSHRKQIFKYSKSSKQCLYSSEMSKRETHTIDNSLELHAYLHLREKNYFSCLD